MASDGTAFVTDWDLQVHAINADGSDRWVKKDGVTPYSFALGADDTLYVASDWGRVSARDPKTGDEKWATLPLVGTLLESNRPLITVTDPPEPDPARPGAAFDDPHPRVLASSDGGFVYSLDARNGNLEWTSRQTRWARPAPRAMPDGTIAAPAADSHVYGLDPDSGTVLWKWPLPTKTSPLLTVDPTGRLLCGCQDGTVRMAEPAHRFEQAAREMTEALAGGAAQDPGVAPRVPPASVQVEDDWIVVGSVRIPRRGG